MSLMLSKRSAETDGTLFLVGFASAGPTFCKRLKGRLFDESELSRYLRLTRITGCLGGYLCETNDSLSFCRFGPSVRPCRISLGKIGVRRSEPQIDSVSVKLGRRFAQEG